MKTLLFFTDTETTGLLQSRDQILSYSMVFCDKDQVLMEKEIRINIKDNVFPNAAALIINNLNPFSPEYNKESISEYKAAHLLAQTMMDYKKQGYRIVLIAYNADFDVEMYTAMFDRCGININALVDFVYDPLITAKALVADGTLKTREVKAGYGGKTYKSSKLEDVYNALGYSSESIKAHNALEDTKMLKTACMKLYLLFCDKTLDEASVDLSTFEEKELKTIVYSENQNLKIKTIKIIRSAANPTDKEYLPNRQGFFAVDYDAMMAAGENLKSAIVYINPMFILDELDLMAGFATKIENFSVQYEKALTDLVNKMSFPPISVFGTYEAIGFGKVETIAEVKLQNPHVQLTEDQKPLEALAEEYAYAKYNRGWTTKLLGPNHLNEPRQIEVDEQIVVELNPTGIFYIRTDGVATLGTEKKSELLALLVKEGRLEQGTDLYKKVNAFLVPVKSFKNPKHPNVLIKEFNDKKTEIFNGANKLHKEAMKGLLDHYKKINNEPFKDLTTPEFKLNLNIFKKN